MDTSNRSRTSTICLYTAITLLALLVLAPLATRFGGLHFRTGLLATAFSFVGAALLLLCCIVLVMLKRFETQRRTLIYAAVIALVPVYVGASTLLGSRDKPMIHDITTNIVDPPTFQQVLALRAETDNSLELDKETLALQLEAYPQLKGLSLAASSDAARQLVLEVARDMGWEIHESESRPHSIEATATTFWFGFKDDVVIRLRPANSNVHIDLRSASRVGLGDLGANAARIEEFSNRLEKLSP